MKIALVGSSGGHLAQLLNLRPWFQKHDRVWATFHLPDAQDSLADERVWWIHHPTNRNIPNLLRNFRVAWAFFRIERPDIVVSTGAGAAIPFFVLGRLFGSTLAWIEVIDRLQRPSMTGRIVSRVSHLKCVQLEEQLRLYPDAIVIGPLL